MPPKASEKPRTAAAPLFLISGDDDFAVKGRAKQLFEQWCKESEGFDNELIDATGSNSGDALNAIGKLREAMQTLPFFGGSKVIWFQNCNFLGEERAASSQAVTETLADLADEFKTFNWEGVRLIITSPKVDKRKVFYKAIDKLGTVESFAGWSLEDKDWVDAAEMAARQQLRGTGKEISEEALSLLVANVGPNNRLLANEVEKLSLFMGVRQEITMEDIEAVVSRNKQAKAFALADAVGVRDMGRLLKTLDQELWALERDSQKSEIGILYGIISKVRTILFLKEMTKEGWITPGVDYNRFKSSLERIPPEALPPDRKFNPLAMHPYMLYNSLAHTKNYTSEELIRAMELLLTANQRLVTTSADAALVFQDTLIKIVQPPPNRGTGF
ncbi:MAG TPA: DNA polymerase III subunit delta [Verrucomicrobiae bacterium]|jgi:DNA polymerase-3 subunit delta|nr:DNA polymerase III subunit delta [Verrucomicrobiae bacterium]